MSLFNLNKGNSNNNAKLLQQFYSLSITFKLTDFLTTVKAMADSENTSKTPQKPLKPTLYQMYPFLCAIPVDQTGFLSISDAECYCAYDGYVTRSDLADEKFIASDYQPKLCNFPSKEDYEHEIIDIGFDAHTSFKEYMRKKRKKGYNIITVPLMHSIDCDSIRKCNWCGNILSPNLQSNIKYCDNEHFCKKKAESFMKTYRKILDVWDKYREYLRNGNIEKANELKAKSEYSYLLNDDRRYLWVTTLINEGKTPLKRIKAMLRPLRYADSWDANQLVMFDEVLYTGEKIAAICPTCGRLIRDGQNISARYCSNKCYRTALLNMKREPEVIKYLIK